MSSITIRISHMCWANSTCLQFILQRAQNRKENLNIRYTSYAFRLAISIFWSNIFNSNIGYQPHFDFFLSWWQVYAIMLIWFLQYFILRLPVSHIDVYIIKYTLFLWSSTFAVLEVIKLLIQLMVVQCEFSIAL